MMHPDQRQLRLQFYLERERDLDTPEGMAINNKAILKRCSAFFARRLKVWAAHVAFRVHNSIWTWYTRSLIPYEEELKQHQVKSGKKARATKKIRPCYFKLGTRQVRQGWRLQVREDHAFPNLSHQFLYKIWTADGEFGGD